MFLQEKIWAHFVTGCGIGKLSLIHILDLDVGVNRLVHQLEAKGELDDTAFVFYADHNCYYNQQNYLLKDIPTTEYWNTELYNIPFFIWSGNCMDLNLSLIHIYFLRQQSAGADRTFF